MHGEAKYFGRNILTRCDKLRVAHRKKGSMGFKIGAPRVVGKTARGRHAPPTAATRRHFSGKRSLPAAVCGGGRAGVFLTENQFMRFPCSPVFQFI